MVARKLVDENKMDRALAVIKLRSFRQKMIDKAMKHLDRLQELV